MPNVYKVSIAQIAGPAEQGFIDDKKIQYRSDEPYSLTVEQCDANRRGVLRWVRIIESISMAANPTITEVEAVGATATSPATEFKFTVTFVSDAALTITRDDVVMENDEALKQLIAEALVGDVVKHVTVQDPEVEGEGGTMVAGKVERVLDMEVLGLGADVDAVKGNITITIE